jgi:uncharacterized protein (DUF433 family)
MEIPTEHPHVVRDPEVCGGAPIIRGTQVSLLHFAVLWKQVVAPEEILQSCPHLTAAQVYDAISYYLDHQQEIEQELQALRRSDSLAAQHDLMMDAKGFLRPRKATVSAGP